MDAVTEVRESLTELGIDFEESTPATFVAVLPGEQKLRTTVSLVVGRHSLTANAFVARRPDQNSHGVHEWLLKQNAKHPGVAFGIDPLGDVYVVSSMPLAAVNLAELDQLLGRILSVADTSFNVLLELGFADSIRREWAWRVSRGEPLDNLRAFAHLVDDDAGNPAS